MSRPNKFTFQIHDTLTWTVDLYIHARHKAYCQWRRNDFKVENDDSEACCIQVMKFDAGQLRVADIHIPADRLKLSSIAHEATHVAWHRARLIGYPLQQVPENGVSSYSYEEEVAWCVGKLTFQIVNTLQKSGYKIDLKTY